MRILPRQLEFDNDIPSIDASVKSHSSCGVGSRKFCEWSEGYRKNAFEASLEYLFGHSYS